MNIYYIKLYVFIKSRVQIKRKKIVWFILLKIYYYVDVKNIRYEVIELQTQISISSLFHPPKKGPNYATDCVYHVHEIFLN